MSDTAVSGAIRRKDIAALRQAKKALEALLEPCPPPVHVIGPDGECPTCPVEEQARAAIQAIDERMRSMEDTCG